MGPLSTTAEYTEGREEKPRKGATTENTEHTESSQGKRK